MSIAVFILVLTAPALLLWDAIHDRIDSLHAYLTLWLVCLSAAVLLT